MPTPTTNKAPAALVAAPAILPPIPLTQPATAPQADSMPERKPWIMELPTRDKAPGMPDVAPDIRPHRPANQLAMPPMPPATAEIRPLIIRPNHPIMAP